MENIASSSSGASSDGPDKQFDSVESTNYVNIHDVVGNRVIGHKIMGFVARHGSLGRASLTSKTFYAAHNSTSGAISSFLRFKIHTPTSPTA